MRYMHRPTPANKTPEEYIAWLRGFVDAVKTDKPCRDQWQTLKYHLSGVSMNPTHTNKENHE